MDRFIDRRVIVTGAGSGIGAATVARLLDEGGTVVAYDFSAGGLARTTAVAEEAGTADPATRFYTVGDYHDSWRRRAYGSCCLIERVKANRGFVGTLQVFDK
jgi:NAD(P)-dependent dehydrogenase (short-subunit alcohol dehydrogenase family)